MDNHYEHDIDQVFRERFDGLKDRSVDPSAQWANVEQQLVGSPSLTVVGSSATTTSVWSSAAALAGVVLVSGMMSHDSPRMEIGAVAINGDEQTTIDARITADQNEVAATYESGSLTSVSTPSSEEAAVVESKNLLAAVYDSGDQNEIAHSSQSSSDDFGHIDFTAREHEPLQLIDRLELEGPILAGVLDRAELAKPELTSKPGVLNGLYARAGLRIGNGESNCSYLPAEWRVNNVIALGYELPVSNNTFLSMEVGHLRRSGNGIERSKNVDLTPIIGVIASAYNPDDPQALLDELKNVRESLVATTLDYVHIPVRAHVRLNGRSNASIGFNADYLVRARNESFMVYNSQDYIPANFGSNDRLSKEGLKRLRFGIMAGYEFKFDQHFSADVRGMIPITSMYDRKSAYSIHQEPSQLVDFQLGVTYRI